MMNKQHTDNLTADEQQLIALYRGEQWKDIIKLMAAKIPPMAPDDLPPFPDADPANAEKTREAAYIEVLEQRESQRQEHHMRVSWAIFGALIAAYILPEPSRAFAAEEHTLATGVIFDTLETWFEQ